MVTVKLDFRPSLDSVNLKMFAGDESKVNASFFKSFKEYCELLIENQDVALPDDLKDENLLSTTSFGFIMEDLPLETIKDLAVYFMGNQPSSEKPSRLGFDRPYFEVTSQVGEKTIEEYYAMLRCGVPKDEAERFWDSRIYRKVTLIINARDFIQFLKTACSSSDRMRVLARDMIRKIVAFSQEDDFHNVS